MDELIVLTDLFNTAVTTLNGQAAEVKASIDESGKLPEVQAALAGWQKHWSKQKEVSMMFHLRSQC